MTKFQKVAISKIFLSEGHDFKGRHGAERLNHGVSSVTSVECVAGRGLLGDRYFDYKEDFKGQITFFQAEVAKELQRFLDLKELDVSALRRNIVISGINLNELIGVVFELNGIPFLGVEECAPCYWMDEAMGNGTEKFLKGRGGLRCRILETGRLSVGAARLRIIERA